MRYAFVESAPFSYPSRCAFDGFDMYLIEGILGGCRCYCGGIGYRGDGYRVMVIWGLKVLGDFRGLGYFGFFLA